MQSEFFEKYIYPVRHKLFRFACRITGDSAHAEDVVQEVFTKIWRQKDRMVDVQNWEAWCMTMTRNYALNRRRAESKKPQSLSAEVFQIQDMGSNHVDSFAENDIIREIKKKMQQLPENQKLCMHLRDIEEYSYAEIAETLNLTQQQVKSNIHRARKTMRTLIDKRILQK